MSKGSHFSAYLLCSVNQAKQHIKVKITCDDGDVLRCYAVGVLLSALSCPTWMAGRATVLDAVNRRRRLLARRLNFAERQQ